MKKNISVNALCLFTLLLVNCNPQETSHKKEDSSSVDKNSIANPDESTIIAVGNFHRKKENCKSGFGICDLYIKDPENEAAGADTLSGSAKGIDAVLSLATDDSSKMVIEFNEEVPNFQNQFIVDSVVKIKSVRDFPTVSIQPGTYTTNKSTGQYGNVIVNIKREGK